MSKPIRRKSFLAIPSTITRSRVAARGSFLLRVLGTAAIFLFACGFNASDSKPNSRGATARLSSRHIISLNGPNETQPVSAEVGLEVGKQAPVFTLKDQNERLVSLQELLKKGPVALVFYRSADWCPYCKQQLVDLERNLKEIEAGGGQLIGISYDSLPLLKRFANKRISFPLLSDSTSRTIEAYGVRDKSTKDGVAFHATFIVDQKGIVRAKLYQVSYAQRPAVDALVKAIAEVR